MLGRHDTTEVDAGIEDIPTRVSVGAHSDHDTYDDRSDSDSCDRRPGRPREHHQSLYAAATKLGQHSIAPVRTLGVARFG
jgi:hypothetical protein